MSEATLSKQIMNEIARYSDGMGCTRRQLVDNIVVLVNQFVAGPAQASVSNHVLTCALCGRQWTVNSDDTLECFFVGICYWCIRQHHLSKERLDQHLQHLLPANHETNSVLKAREIVEEYKQRVMLLPSGDAVPCARWLEMRLRIALDLAAVVQASVPPCVNCSHTDVHNGPAGTVNDACTHEGCNCGYYVASVPAADIRSCAGEILDYCDMSEHYNTDGIAAIISKHFSSVPAEGGDNAAAKRNDSNMQAWREIFDRVNSTVPYSDEQPLRQVIKDANTVIRLLYKEVESLRCVAAAPSPAVTEDSDGK